MAGEWPRRVWIISSRVGRVPFTPKYDRSAENGENAHSLVLVEKFNIRVVRAQCCRDFSGGAVSRMNDHLLVFPVGRILETGLYVFRCQVREVT